ncbi:hypothetical protein [Streptomyces sp. SM1]|uniref:hypothetical protein n=1 Tax=Streptomyces sp. SM1 TaxID=402229 RepID=UPI000CD546F7|nr:hypothetical protein [Streptomyces sp. SM1]
MALEEAEAANVTPQEALLGFVRSAAGQSAFLGEVVRAKLQRHVADGGDPLDPPKELVLWLRQARDERSAAARIAKSAVDAGAVAALERRLDLEGETVADALAAVLDALGLDQEQRIFALAVAQAKLSGEALPSGPAPKPVVEEQPDLMRDFRKLAEENGLDPEGLDDEDEDGDDDDER